MNNEKTIIFDFDGTIADTLGLALEIYNKKIVPRFNARRATKEDLEYVRNQKPSRKLLKEYNISLFQLPFIIRRGRAEIKKEIKEADLQPGIEELLRKLKDYPLGILSSNSEENIKIFLARHKILDVFSFFYCSSPLFRKDKIIKRILKEGDLNPENVYYIGDEVRDIVSANKAGIKTIAVTWGFNKKEILEKTKPDYLFEKPLQILELFDS